MVSTTAALSALTVAVLATSTGVDAHGTLAQPLPTFTGSGYGGNFASRVEQSALPLQRGDSFRHYPDANMNIPPFKRAWAASKYKNKTFKDFILGEQKMPLGRSNMPKTPECGFTNPNGAARALPDQLVWYGGGMNHPGPCEVWCDDEVVLPMEFNCAQKWPSGRFPYNKAKCQGKKRMTMYWMSTIMEWQVYTQCINIGGTGKRSNDESDDQEYNSYNATAYDGAADAAHEAEDNGWAAQLRSVADEPATVAPASDDVFDTEREGAYDEILPTPSDEELAAQAEAQEAEDAARAAEAEAAYEGY